MLYVSIDLYIFECMSVCHICVFHICGYSCKNIDCLIMISDVCVNEGITFVENLLRKQEKSIYADFFFLVFKYLMILTKTVFLFSGFLIKFESEYQ